jgi:hypothetical protein
MGLDDETKSDMVLILNCYKKREDLSLRDMERLLTILALASTGPAKLDTMLGSFRLATLTLALLKMKQPSVYRTYIDGAPKLTELSKILRLTNGEDRNKDRNAYILWRGWSVFLAPANISRKDRWHKFDPSFPLDDPSGALGSLIESYLETFEITAPPTS